MDANHDYREVSRGGTAYPMMSIASAGQTSVVHLFRDPDSCFLLDGDQVVDEREAHRFPILGSEVPISGAFICTTGRAQAVVEQFARGADPDDLGTWTAL